MADPNALAGTHISSVDIVESAVHIVDINDTTDPADQSLVEEGEGEVIEHIVDINDTTDPADQSLVEEGEGEVMEHIHGVIQEGHGVIPESAEIHHVIQGGAEIREVIQDVVQEDGEIDQQVLNEAEGGEIHQVIQIGEGGEIHQVIENCGEIQGEIEECAVLQGVIKEDEEVIHTQDIPDDQAQIIQISVSQIAEVIAKEQQRQEQQS
jgi:hypothetical protein